MTVRMVDRTGKTILETMLVLGLPKGDYDVVILYDPINASDIMLSGEGTTSRPSPTTSGPAPLREAFNLYRTVVDLSELDRACDMMLHKPKDTVSQLPLEGKLG